MTVEELVERLKDFDANLPVRLGADGSILGEAKSVYIEENLPADNGGGIPQTVIIAEWD